MTAAGLPAVHHNATQSVLSALQTLLQLTTVGITVLLDHLTWREGGEGSGCEGREREGRGVDVRGREERGGEGEWGLCKEGMLLR